jgi:hypothetical protein
MSFGLGNSSGRGSSYIGRSAYKSDGQKPVYNGLGYANGDYQMKHATGNVISCGCSSADVHQNNRMKNRILMDFRI